jgi:SSS family solute:Na+ symporter
MFKGGWLTDLLGMKANLYVYPVEMAQNFWTAIFAFTTAVVLTVGLSFATKQQKSDEELKGLVYSLTPRVKVHVDEWYNRPVVLAVIVGVIMISLSIIFW